MAAKTKRIFQVFADDTYVGQVKASTKAAALKQVRGPRSRFLDFNDGRRKLTVRAVGELGNPSKRSTRKRVSKALTKYVRGENAKRNPAKRVTIRDAKSVTLTRLPGGGVSVRVVKKRRR